MYFKVTCEFYIKAKDQNEAEEIVAEEGHEIVENHLIFSETDKKTAEKEGIYNEEE